MGGSSHACLRFQARSARDGTREEARENVVDALRTVLTPDEELAGKRSEADLEHVHFVAAA
jgi:hypothetical protein